MDFDNVSKHDIDWDDVRFQEMFYLNDIEGFFHERLMLFVDNFLSKLQDNELLFLKLNNIAVEALIAAIKHHPLFEVTAKEVKPKNDASARSVFNAQVAKESNNRTVLNPSLN